VVYQEIQFHSWFALDLDGRFLNNKAFLLPTGDLYVAAVLNSSLIWWFLERFIGHMKDEAFAMQGFRVDHLPVPRPVPAKRDRIVHHAERLVAMTRRRHEEAEGFHRRLADATSVERITRKLETYWKLDERAFLDQIRKGRGRIESKDRLISAFAKSRDDQRMIWEETRRLEIDLHNLVFDLYGLTESEVKLLRETAPPRDPLILTEAEQEST
jgi:hypothetical protein